MANQIKLADGPHTFTSSSGIVNQATATAGGTKLQVTVIASPFGSIKVTFTWDPDTKLYYATGPDGAIYFLATLDNGDYSHETRWPDGGFLQSNGTYV